MDGGDDVEGLDALSRVLKGGLGHGMRITTWSRARQETGGEASGLASPRTSLWPEATYCAQRSPLDMARRRNRIYLWESVGRPHEDGKDDVLELEQEELGIEEGDTAYAEICTRRKGRDQTLLNRSTERSAWSRRDGPGISQTLHPTAVFGTYSHNHER